MLRLEIVMGDVCFAAHTPTRQVLGIAYVESPTQAFNDNLLITTIYGIDLNPEGSGLLLTGVTGSSPETWKHHSSPE
jgi:hypothetical protein